MSGTNKNSPQEVFDALCGMFDNEDWNYEKVTIGDDLAVSASVSGDDLPIDFFVMVNGDNDQIVFVSQLPVSFDESKRIEGAIASCYASSGLAYGSFDYDLEDGKVMYRSTSSYRGCTFTEDFFRHIVYLSIAIVDKYNDKFFMLGKNMMSLEQFMESDN